MGKRKKEGVFKSQANKFIFFMFSFDMKELHTLFMKFYQEFDQD